ncbi:uncharacterized protein PGTG_20875 [Puccinia graminis f. sp. tritici CRL 75-36-700-3]|uniref:Tyr recombinase domain-containing protein n=1 Tax=Puccinia graminis f. sp. tritici (strain CRL 75-36-700-3 / race SCCL) TaxID=418459 RepID=H6QPK8_PUCGT|nr:uncharacterized protein PGTG_20875 [Puccinia graminis f. sp. tritici CRL 75-36-700-3]EHS63893.1 hypothetical protein PGTG_20875 [Puccinia graminis f. sp. tritici CRL 75-36-700-3]
MNIDLWKIALKNAKILTKYQDVLFGFEHGFHQGIPTHKLGNLRWFTPDNHRSAILAEKKIRESMDKELQQKRMFGPFDWEEVSRKFSFFRTNPLGAVVNGDGSVRPINDLSFPHGDPSTPSVNSFVNKDNFETTWDDFNEVSSFFRSCDGPVLLALFDWEKAYRQIPTRPSQWPYLMVKGMDGNLYLDTRITFGGVAGCGSFGRPADAWKEIMFAEFDLVKVFRWVDDNLFIKKPTSTTDMKDIVKRSTDLGVLTNLKKCSIFSDEQKFIGFLWNGANKTVRLPQEKLNQRKSQIEEFLDTSRKFSFNEVEVLTGRLNHVSYMLPQLRCYLRSLYRWMLDWFDIHAKRYAPNDVLEDLNRWKNTLNTFKHERLISVEEPIDIGWVGDASTSFGIGVVIGKYWSQLRILKPRNQQSRKWNIAWLETAAVRAGLLMLQALNRLKKGSNVLVWTDNTTTESAILKRKSGDDTVNEEWKLIQDFLMENEIDLTGKRVKSGDNVADNLSRGRIEMSEPSNLIIIDNEPLTVGHLNKIKAFVANGTTHYPVSTLNAHLLTGWKWNTILGYNAAVKKFIFFKNLSGNHNFKLPTSTKDIEDFCFWAGRNLYLNNSYKISSASIKKYLCGLKAWHTFHSQDYPDISDKRIELLLKASARIDATIPAKPKKPPILLKHLIWLANALFPGGDIDKSIMDLAIVAFWGMARIGELTYANTSGDLNNEDSVLTSDVRIVRSAIGEKVILTVRNAKTAQPGKPQEIVLHSLKNMLCPVLAIKRRLEEADGAKTSLFGFSRDGVRRHMTRSIAVNRIQLVLRAGGFEGLLGHSFRVGGASLRYALGTPVEEICLLGRWISNCYRLYIREYSVEDKLDSKRILDELNELWEED